MRTISWQCSPHQRGGLRQYQTAAIITALCVMRNLPREEDRCTDFPRTFLSRGKVFCVLRLVSYKPPPDASCTQENTPCSFQQIDLLSCSRPSHHIRQSHTDHRPSSVSAIGSFFVEPSILPADCRWFLIAVEEDLLRRRLRLRGTAIGSDKCSSVDSFCALFWLF